MRQHRRRPIVYAIAGLAAVWLLAAAGWTIAHRAKVTAEKVAERMRAVDLAKLTGDARANALDELARMMVALPVEERRRARLDGSWEQWFAAMSEEEKGRFIEATMPSGFKQMLASFEQLPEDKRKETINRALRDLKKSREELGAAGAFGPERGGGAVRPAELSPELQQKVVKMGLKSFYSESSAQSKAELAPLLEEMQLAMESGVLFRGERR